MFNLGFLWLALSIGSEITGTSMIKKTNGFSKLAPSVLVVCGGTAFVGCAESETTEKTLSGTVYGDYTEETVHELYGAKLQYIGDHIGVGKILGLLPLPEGVTNDSEGISRRPSGL